MATDFITVLADKVLPTFVTEEKITAKYCGHSLLTLLIMGSNIIKITIV
jgi:uncharacterized protein (DUF2336 family)